MLAVTELALLTAWESAHGRTSPERAVVFAATAGGLPLDAAADLPIGRRNELLLDLCESCFGSRFDGVASCPRCALELDVQISAEELRLTTETPQTATIAVGDQTVAVRALNSRDVELAGPHRDRLLTRCLVGPDVVVTDAVLTAIESELDALDPAAAPSVDLDCPDCGHNWSAPIEPAEFVWDEVDRFARRLLADVHSLASAYGWRESDVLAISPARRAFYLQACAS